MSHNEPVYRCDRCGDLADGRASDYGPLSPSDWWTFFQTANQYGREARPLDLCPDCYETVLAVALGPPMT